MVPLWFTHQYSSSCWFKAVIPGSTWQTKGSSCSSLPWGQPSMGIAATRHSMLSLGAQEMSCTFSGFAFMPSVPIPSRKLFFFRLVIDSVGYWARIHSGLSLQKGTRGREVFTHWHVPHQHFCSWSSEGLSYMSVWDSKDNESLLRQPLNHCLADL